MDGADVALICVGTPFDGKTIDLSYVLQVSREIGQVLKDQAAAAKAAGKQPHYCVVTVKSTVVPGTTDTVVRKAIEEASGLVAGKDFGLGMNPEFLAEGVAVKDFQELDRIVVGGIDACSTAQLAEIVFLFNS